jgi:hypothetical protein
LIAAGAYVSVIAGWLYLPVGEMGAFALLLVAGALTVVVAAWIGRWWVFLLPLVAIPIAVPRGYDPEIAVWFDVALFFVPPALILAGLGIIGGKLARRRRPSPTAH